MSWLSGQLEGWLGSARTLEALAAILVGIPLLFGGFGSLMAGAISNRLLSRGGDVVRIRRLFAISGFTGAAALLMASFYIKDPLLAMLSMGMASFCNDLTMPGSWTTCMDVGGKYAGTLSGTMNMAGNLGGVLSPIVIAYILSQSNNNWALTFYVSAAVYFAGIFFWLALDPVTMMEQE